MKLFNNKNCQEGFTVYLFKYIYTVYVFILSKLLFFSSSREQDFLVGKSIGLCWKEESFQPLMQGSVLLLFLVFCFGKSIGLCWKVGTHVI